MPCFFNHWWLKSRENTLKSESQWIRSRPRNGAGLQLSVNTQLQSDQSVNQLTLTHPLICFCLSADRFPAQTLWSQTKQRRRAFLSVSTPFFVCAIQRGKETQANWYLLICETLQSPGPYKKSMDFQGPLTCTEAQRDFSFFFWCQGIWCHNLKDSYCTSKGSCYGRTVKLVFRSHF